MSRIKRKTILRLLKESHDVLLYDILVHGRADGDHSPLALRINELTYETYRVLARCGVFNGERISPGPRLQEREDEL